MTEAPTNLLAMAETFLERSSRAVREDGKPAIFDASALQGIYDIKARPGAITARMKVLEGHRNFMGNLHGGCTATLVDVVGSAALCTTTAKPHVSLSITTNYLRGAPLGSTIRVEAVVIKPGESVMTVEVNIYDDATGKLVAQGTHIKYSVNNVSYSPEFFGKDPPNYSKM